MLRKRFVAVGFMLALGLAGCAPPAEEPKAEGTAAVTETPAAAPAAAPAAEPAPAPAPREEAAAPRPKPRPRPAAEPAPPAPPPVCNECGVIASIDAVKVKGEGSGAGAVLGAIAGGVIGHQFGGGKGKDVATAAGAIAGGFGGHQAEKQIRSTTHYKVGVNMENGTYQSVDVDDPAGLSIGSRVRVVGGNLQPR